MKLSFTTSDNDSEVRIINNSLSRENFPRIGIDEYRENILFNARMISSIFNAPDKENLVYKQSMKYHQKKKR